ncbi:MAG: hypothetical protein PHY69_09320 [Dysgonamonadaceae bacterium]|nr:hypothetical protein [Dysgonamonadaceae bacterium]MDD3901476.1 hypothetical protein [Dysgonamonadaceae bacterium]
MKKIRFIFMMILAFIFFCGCRSQKKIATTTNNVNSNEISTYSNENKTVESMEQCTSDDIYTVITETEYSEPDTVAIQYKQKEKKTEQHRVKVILTKKDANKIQEEQAETIFQKQDESNYETQTEDKKSFNWRFIIIVVLVIGMLILFPLLLRLKL